MPRYRCDLLVRGVDGAEQVKVVLNFEATRLAIAERVANAWAEELDELRLAPNLRLVRAGVIVAIRAGGSWERLIDD
jgi:hypothetical protein